MARATSNAPTAAYSPAKGPKHSEHQRHRGEWPEEMPVQILGDAGGMRRDPQRRPSDQRVQADADSPAQRVRQGSLKRYLNSIAPLSVFAPQIKNMYIQRVLKDN
jgi:hypothetical protein